MNTHAPADTGTPWVPVDDLTVNQTANLLERLVHWLDGPDTAAAERCTRALSLGETSDPESISGWADTLAARLRDLADPSPAPTPVTEHSQTD